MEASEQVETGGKKNSRHASWDSACKVAEENAVVYRVELKQELQAEQRESAAVSIQAWFHGFLVRSFSTSHRVRLNSDSLATVVPVTPESDALQDNRGSSKKAKSAEKALL